jgi:hypothetical protein
LRWIDGRGELSKTGRQQLAIGWNFCSPLQWHRFISGFAHLARL